MRGHIFAWLFKPVLGGFLAMSEELYLMSWTYRGMQAMSAQWLFAFEKWEQVSKKFTKAI